MSCFFNTPDITIINLYFQNQQQESLLTSRVRETKGGRGKKKGRRRKRKVRKRESNRNNTGQNKHFEG